MEQIPYSEPFRTSHSMKRRSLPPNQLFDRSKMSLLKLNKIGTSGAHWWSKKPATAYRTAYLMRKMLAAENSIEKLEATNVDLKKLVAKCE